MPKDEGTTRKQREILPLVMQGYHQEGIQKQLSEDCGWERISDKNPYKVF